MKSCNPTTLCAVKFLPQPFQFSKVFQFLCLHSLCLAGTKTLLGHQTHTATRAVFSDMSLACTTKVLNKNITSTFECLKNKFVGVFIGLSPLMFQKYQKSAETPKKTTLFIQQGCLLKIHCKNSFRLEYNSSTHHHHYHYHHYHHHQTIIDLQGLIDAHRGSVL